MALDKLINVVKTAASFLQEGTAPPNTPPERMDKMKSTNHLASKKFFLAFSGFIILAVFYVFSIGMLFLMAGTPALLSPYVVLFSKTMEVFAVVMATYLGGQALIDLRYNSSSNASVEGKIEEVNITKKVVGNIKEDDYTLTVENHED